MIGAASIFASGISKSPSSAEREGGVCQALIVEFFAGRERDWGERGRGREATPVAFVDASEILNRSFFGVGAVLDAAARREVSWDRELGSFAFALLFALGGLGRYSGDGAQPVGVLPDALGVSDPMSVQGRSSNLASRVRMPGKSCAHVLRFVSVRMNDGSSWSRCG